jgi:DNA-binding protein YbaB
MPSPYEELAGQAVAAYQKRLDDLVESRRKLAEVSATVVAPRQVVSVTVGGQGEITDVKFPAGAYKNMTPAELAEVILKTAKDAREQALSKSAKVLAPMLPDGFSADAILAGKADLTSMVPAEPRALDDLRLES